MQKVNWSIIKDHAVSAIPMDRIHALIQAVSALELALKANGKTRSQFKKNRGVVNVLCNMIAEEQLFEDIRTHVPIIAKAFKARHAATHEYTPPDEASCEAYVEILEAVWELLRERYVTEDNAAKLARDFLRATPMSFYYEFFDDESSYDEMPVGEVSNGEGANDPFFTNVFLFGSLARFEGKHSDIDLLLVENNHGLASIESGYFAGSTDKEEQILEQLDSQAREPMFATKENLAGVRCGWLNLSIVQGNFGESRMSRRTATALQSDPFFYLNIAEDLKVYDRDSDSWKKDAKAMPIFAKLADLRRRLEDLGVAPPRREVKVTQRSDMLILELNPRILEVLDFLRKSFVDTKFVSRGEAARRALVLGLRERLNKQPEMPEKHSCEQKLAPFESDISLSELALQLERKLALRRKKEANSGDDD